MSNMKNMGNVNEMSHNVRLCYKAIKDGIARDKSYVVSYEPSCGRDACRVNGHVAFFMSGCSKGSLREDFHKAVWELRKEEGFEKAHLVCGTYPDGGRASVVRVSLKDYRRERLGEGEVVYLVERYDTDACTRKLIGDVIARHPEYELRLRSGYGFKGAKVRLNQSMADLEKLLDWSCAEDLEVDHGSRFILVNGFSANDMC